MTFPQLGLKFPREDAEGAAAHIIDLAKHAEAALAAADGNTYPLIIRLETVTERGLKEGHTLQVRFFVLDGNAQAVAGCVVCQLWMGAPEEKIASVLAV